MHQMSVPGFNVYYNKSKKGTCRGGVMMLVKCVLTQYIMKVDTDVDDMIWVKLSLCSGVMLGGVLVLVRTT